MTLILDNPDVARVLTMTDTVAALEESYRMLAAGDGVCRPRIDIRIPTSDPRKVYQWGTMEGGARRGTRPRDPDGMAASGYSRLNCGQTLSHRITRP